MSVEITDSLSKWKDGEYRRLDGKLFGVATSIQRLSQMYAPIDSGVLKSSHRTNRISNFKYEVSANTPYARRRHFENKKNPGTKMYLSKAGDAIARNIVGSLS